MLYVFIFLACALIIFIAGICVGCYLAARDSRENIKKQSRGGL
jgi:uncharacterized protein YneF (UPF0154 family)